MTPHWTEWNRAGREATARAERIRAQRRAQAQRRRERRIGFALAMSVAGALGYIGAAFAHLT